MMIQHSDATASTGNETAERVGAILNAIATLAIERGWSREDVAVAMAKGAGELARHGSDTSADLDRSIGALVSMVHSAASGGAIPASFATNSGQRH